MPVNQEGLSRRVKVSSCNGVFCITSQIIYVVVNVFYSFLSLVYMKHANIILRAEVHRATVFKISNNADLSPSV